jgi:hypothetical protein
MTCNCIAEFNAKLDGQELDASIAFCRERNTMTLQTYTRLIRKDTQREERRTNKPRLAAHTFCPFCGTRYEPLSVATAPVEEGGAA